MKRARRAACASQPTYAGLALGRETLTSPVNLVIGRWKWVRRGGEGPLAAGRGAGKINDSRRAPSPRPDALISTTCRGHWPARRRYHGAS
ncbi:unnamed protein product [Colias eurytheme]|nr:unnamed protein product [Colias eurytheme]